LGYPETIPRGEFGRRPRRRIISPNGHPTSVHDGNVGNDVFGVTDSHGRIRPSSALSLTRYGREPEAGEHDHDTGDEGKRIA
jgi:hypothetical protein